MIDLQITSLLDIEPDDTGDLPLVEGRDAYNQTIALGTLDAYYQEIGTLDKVSALNRLQSRAREIARQYPDYIDQVHSIQAEYSDDQQTEAVVNITYLTGENFSFDIQ